MNATLNPEVLKWAREKAGLSEETLAAKIGVKLGLVREWEKSGTIPFSVVEELAKITRIAFGFLFLSHPPKQTLPIADFRCRDSIAPPAPSDELLEVIYDAQRKQNWYREYLISIGNQPVPFVGKCSNKTPVKDTASDIRKTLHIGPALAAQTKRWEETIKLTIEAAEKNGILVLRTGYAGSFTGRKLDVDEFQGFSLCDSYAPLIFVNGADYYAAQIFTIAHEIAHIWIGETGLSILDRTYSKGTDVENYCNAVAAEVLLPLDEIRAAWHRAGESASEINRLSDKYKASRIVVARRAKDAGLVSDEEFVSYYKQIVAQIKKASGGTYYQNEHNKHSRIFSAALIQETLAGRVNQREAMDFLGIKKEATFKKFANSLEGGTEWPIS
jgi:Zn-dependent peptidase ImmA (M78 family)/DNA-binding XRE family transcriptional regulator